MEPWPTIGHLWGKSGPSHAETPGARGQSLVISGVSSIADAIAAWPVGEEFAENPSSDLWITLWAICGNCAQSWGRDGDKSGVSLWTNYG